MQYHEPQESDTEVLKTVDLADSDCCAKNSTFWTRSSVSSAFRFSDSPKTWLLVVNYVVQQMIIFSTICRILTFFRAKIKCCKSIWSQKTKHFTHDCEKMKMDLKTLFSKIFIKHTVFLLKSIFLFSQIDSFYEQYVWKWCEVVDCYGDVEI